MAGESHVSSNTTFAGNVTILGTATVPGVWAPAGGIAVNTNKFTVDATTGDTLIAGTVTRVSQKYFVPATLGSKVGTGAGFVVAAADNTALVTCPASQSAAILILPLTGLKVGWTITSMHLVGQIESAGGTVTVDMDIRKMTAAAADPSDASLDTMTQLSVTADTIMSAANTSKTLTTPDVVGADELFYAKITVTTGSACDIALMGLSYVVTEA